ncbi:MAG: aminotransferase class I and II [Actinomycetota bacterium]|nr:aminotransferase class I and II [Actinomycetota bacterium]
MVTRYVTPLREGGSLPGLVEAADDGTYVAKFRGAGQGVKVLVAEILVAGLAALVDVPVPRLVALDLDAQIAKYEADEEVQDLLTASIGLNLGVDFLPGSFGYDGTAPPPPDLAARIIWLDALTANVDRTWANPNLLVWNGRTWAIDHGAALYVHHSWPGKEPDPTRFAGLALDTSKHVLRDVASRVASVHDELVARLTPPAVADVVSRVPDEWLEPTPWLADAGAVRVAYEELLRARLSSRVWVPGV